MTKVQKLKPADEIRHSLELMEPRFAAVLPSNISHKKFVDVVMIAIRKIPKLEECNRDSLYLAAMECAKQGLLPDGIEATLLPYGNMVRFAPMIYGIAKRVRNSGQISMLDAQVVYENDQFGEWIDEKGPHFRHVRARGDRGKPILTYAYAITKDGDLFFEQMDEQEMLKIEKMSKAKDSPWKGDFRDEMKRKTAIRRLAKYRLPSSADIDGLVKAEDDIYELKQESKKPELKEATNKLLNAMSQTEEIPDFPGDITTIVAEVEESKEIDLPDPFDKKAKETK